MGTDIHPFMEVKKNGVWVTADRWEKDEYDEDHNSVPYDEHIYGDRNYSLFAALANIRNGSGFAGCDTGDCIPVISEPRGIPDDACKEIKQEWKEYGEHTPSWLTLREILEWDWDFKQTKRGYMSKETYKEWKDSGDAQPNGWCGGGSGGTWITEEEYLQREGLWNQAEDRVMIQCEWKVPFRESVSHFLETSVPKMQTMGEPDDVRMVFWFDS